MKLLVFTAVFGASLMAMGQSTGEKQADPVTVYQLPSTVVPLDRNSVRIPDSPFNRHVDEGSIVHPPTNFAMQPPRAPLAQTQKLYPDLKLQLTETAKLEAAPTQWPKFRIEPIPTQWQGMTMTPVENKSAAPVTLKKK
jgi:hypothetical protein